MSINTYGHAPKKFHYRLRNGFQGSGDAFYFDFIARAAYIPIDIDRRRFAWPIIFD